MLDYANNKIVVDGCYGCAYANHKFSLPCGMIYENEFLTISQDWELPINGLIVLCPKHCVEKIEDLTENERNQLFKYVGLTTKYLKEINISNYFTIEMEEKKGIHFHISIIPKHSWMIDVAGSYTDNFGEIISYAKKNFKTQKHFDDINKTVLLLKEKFLLTNQKSIQP